MSRESRCRFAGTAGTVFLPLQAGLFLCLAAATSDGQGAVYRCQDSNGEVEYRQTECDTATGEKLDLQLWTIEWRDPDTETDPDSGGGSRRKAGSDESTPVKKKKTAKGCWRARQRIERIDWELRKGYKPSRGERLKQRRREQEAYLRRFCGP